MMFFLKTMGTARALLARLSENKNKFTIQVYLRKYGDNSLGLASASHTDRSSYARLQGKNVSSEAIVAIIRFADIGAKPLSVLSH